LANITGCDIDSLSSARDLDPDKMTGTQDILLYQSNINAAHNALALYFVIPDEKIYSSSARDNANYRELSIRNEKRQRFFTRHYGRICHCFGFFPNLVG
jgi:hypothetical protein